MFHGVVATMPSSERAFMAWSRRSKLQKRSGSGARTKASGGDDLGASMTAILVAVGRVGFFCRPHGIKPRTGGRCNNGRAICGKLYPSVPIARGAQTGGNHGAQTSPGPHAHT